MEQLPKRLNLLPAESQFDRVLVEELLAYTMKLYDLIGKGTIPPRMTTTERDAIDYPIQGLLIFNTTTSKLNFYTGSAWEAIDSS
jgi:hypothetical protein